MIKELNYDLTKEDILKFHYYSCFKNKNYYLVILFFIIFGLFLNFLINEDIGTIVIIMGILFLIIAPGLITLNYKKQNINIIIESDNKIINTKNSIANVEYNWNNIEKICKTKHYLLLFISEYGVLIIPKRIFESEQDMNETWELIQECYNKYRDSETTSE